MSPSRSAGATAAPANGSAPPAIPPPPEPAKGQRVARLGEPFAGHWVLYVTDMTVDQFVALMRSGDSPRAEAEALAAFRERMVDTSLGDPHRMPLMFGIAALRSMDRAEDDAATDPKPAGA